MDKFRPVPVAVDPNIAISITTAPTPDRHQMIYLWEAKKAPTITSYKKGDKGERGDYFDPAEFRPFMETFPVAEGVPIKGAVMVCAGGAFLFRSDGIEGRPVAEELSKLGYQSFVVKYRLRPYTMEEGSLDLARAVRYVRSHAGEYGIDEKNIAVMGFSAGGILCGDMILNCSGTRSPALLDRQYFTEKIDRVSADVAAVGFIYSFYGILSHASADVEKFKKSGLPPAYFRYGTKDPFVSEFEKCIAALREAGVDVESHVMPDTPHGFGWRHGWIDDFAGWLEKVLNN